MSAVSMLLHKVLQSGLCRANTRCSSSSVKFEPFARIEPVAPNEHNRLEAAYHKDTSPLKLNLSGEFYRNSDGKPQVFQAVHKAAIGVACDEKLSQEPLPPLGNADFIKAANELILTNSAEALLEKRVLGVQTRSSLDALRVAAQFLREKMKCNVCLLAKPSSETYERIFKQVGFQCHSYQYFSEAKGELNVFGLVADLMTAPEGTVVLLDACAQNPTGLDPSVDEWKLISHIIKCKKMLPLLHLESHGLATGDVVQDAWPVRYFAGCGFDVLCAQSFVKNFSLYNETVGQLMIVLGNPKHLPAVREHLENMLLTEKEQSSSVFASRIVAKILTTTALHQEWTHTIKDIHQRLHKMRTLFAKKLKELKTPGNWDHLSDQKGPYLYTNLKNKHLQQLQARHIYIPSSGRINVGALRTNNVEYLASAINDVLKCKQTDTVDTADLTSAHLHALQHFFNAA
ncbi:maker751 [Drosophila busckii]|uniref:aspartate transaminase n=1 Tax=Drosophila busckii TaxID=30019 RepID=A0A0M4EKG1_DROBS|nr:maker751 [Drosophila busckii]